MLYRRGLITETNVGLSGAMGPLYATDWNGMALDLILMTAHQMEYRVANLAVLRPFILGMKLDMKADRSSLWDILKAFDRDMMAVIVFYTSLGLYRQPCQPMGYTGPGATHEATILDQKANYPPVDQQNAMGSLQHPSLDTFTELSLACNLNEYGLGDRVQVTHLLHMLAFAGKIQNRDKWQLAHLVVESLYLQLLNI